MTYADARKRFQETNKKVYSILEMHQEKLAFMYFCKDLLAKGEITEIEYLRFTN